MEQSKLERFNEIVFRSGAYEGMARLMCRIALNIVKNSHAAEDVVQGAFLNAVKSIETFRGEMDEGGVTEPEIRKNMPARGIIVSKAIRVMFRADTLERNGQGKKGDPFKYHIVPSLPLDGHSSSLSYKSENLGLAGLESEKQGQPFGKVKENSSPEFRDKDGTRKNEDNPSGLESAKPWEEVPDDPS